MQNSLFASLCRARIGLSAAAAAILVSFVAGSPAALATPIRPHEWPLDQAHFQADRIWPITRGGGVTVAVVDSGVDATHPDLAGRVVAGTDELDDPSDGGKIDTSPESHGTAIAGIIAGNGNSDDGQGMTGLAPDAQILPVRVATGSATDPTALARGIIWAADHQASVINVSIGSPRPDPVLKKAVEYAQAKDAVIVASAGNSGTSGNPEIYPASFPGVVSVSGTDENNSFWAKSESGRHVAVAAPATDIYSTNNQGQYLVANGTSYAAAYVSATAALIRAHQPKLTAGQVIYRLITTTRDHHAYPDPHTGYGILNPLEAVTTQSDTASNDNPLLHPVTAASPSPDRSPLTAGLAVAGTVSLVIAAAAIVWRRRHRQRQPAPKGMPPAVGKNTAGPASRPATPTRQQKRPAAKLRKPTPTRTRAK